MRIVLTLLIAANAYAAKFSTGLKHNDLAPKTNISMTDIKVAIPAKYDLRKVQKMIPIQDQGACGSCWAFSVTATVNDALAAQLPVPDMSPQYLVDCDTTSYGCDGGDFTAFNMEVVPRGTPTLKDYPYTGLDGRCRSKPIAGQILKWYYVGDPKAGPTHTDIQKAILLYGEVSVAMSATDSFMNYKKGLYRACDRDGLNHMVNIVGWSNEGAKADAKGFYPPGKGYWIIRNSWGTGWGEKGWGRVKFTDRSGGKCSMIGWIVALADVAKP